MESPKCKEELLRILYALPYLKLFVPRRADLIAIIKTAVTYTKKEDGTVSKSLEFK